jgi:hypothetical protein
MEISQREARRLRQRVNQLEREIYSQRRYWVADYPGGVAIAHETASVQTRIAIQTARALGHAVVTVQSGESIQYFALPLPKES